MTPERLAELRAEFELAHLGCCLFDRDVCGSYVSPHAAVAWRSWRLARQHEFERLVGAAATKPAAEGNDAPGHPAQFNARDSMALAARLTPLPRPRGPLFGAVPVCLEKEGGCGWRPDLWCAGCPLRVGATEPGGERGA